MRVLTELPSQHQVLTALMQKTCRTRLSGSSNSVVPRKKSDEPGSDECAAPMAKRFRVNDTENGPGEIPIPAAHSDQVLAASGQQRSNAEESCELDTDDRGGERAARLALVEQVVLQLHRTPR